MPDPIAKHLEVLAADPSTPVPSDEALEAPFSPLNDAQIKGYLAANTEPELLTRHGGTVV